jgi:hypothetical protein
MTATPQNTSPADRIIDRRMPNATTEEREEARENLRRLARVILRIDERMAREWYEQRTRESGADAVESDKGTSPPL